LNVSAGRYVTPKTLAIVNVAAPIVLSVLVAATARQESYFLLASSALVIALLGLVLVNLAAPLLFWQRHGVRALVPLTALLLAAVVAGATARYGPRWVLAGTPAMPESFLTQARQDELGAYANYLLSGGSVDSIAPSVRNQGFPRIDVDTSRQVVVLAHYRLRRWHEYLYSPGALEAPYSTKPRLTGAGFRWGELREIARQSDPALRKAQREVDFDSTLAPALVVAALGDSLALDVARRPQGQPILAAEKSRVLAALGRQVEVGSRLIEHPRIRVFGKPRSLHIGRRGLTPGSFPQGLLEKLMQTGALSLAADGEHLTVRESLSGLEAHALEWLQLGLMDQAYGDLFDVRDYSYDRQLAAHWYYRSW